MKKIFAAVLIVLMIAMVSLTGFAHSGRTDSSGGHRDNKNKSGLGSYHYHCGGYPAHLHSGGVCPYKSGGSSDNSSKKTPETVYATGITGINIPSELKVGDSVKLEASVYPANAEDKSILWESSDSEILTVNSTGELKAIAVGTAIVTAKTSRGTSKQFVITVNEIMAESLKLASDNIEMFSGESQVLEYELLPENTTNRKIEWSSSDESIVSVLPNGKITANNPGVATITIVHKELSDCVEIEVISTESESNNSEKTEPDENKDEEIKPTETETKVNSDSDDTTSGILGVAVVGGGIGWYCIHRKNKKKK